MYMSFCFVNIFAFRCLLLTKWKLPTEYCQRERLLFAKRYHNRKSNLLNVYRGVFSWTELNCSKAQITAFYTKKKAAYNMIEIILVIYSPQLQSNEQLNEQFPLQSVFIRTCFRRHIFGCTSIARNHLNTFKTLRSTNKKNEKLRKLKM